MHIRRRVFLEAPVVVGAAGWWSALEAAVILPSESPAPQLYPAEIEALGAYVDTLLPPEHDSPGASALDVHERMAAGASSKPRYLALLQWGTRWLHQEAKARTDTGFAVLDETGRVEVVTLAADADNTSRPRLFFELTRQDAFRYYYADPRSWKALGYAGPPQPAGFLDYTQPPPKAG